MVKGSFRILDFLFEPISPIVPDNADPSLLNRDLQPITIESRTFSLFDMNSLWLGVVVSVTGYYLAGSLVEMGMACWQGILTIVTGTTIQVVLLVLMGHAGTKYGIPFSVLARSSFGIRGAHIPVILRGLVACGWFGIDTWIAGEAIFVFLNRLFHGKLTTQEVSWLGTSLPQFGCFLLFRLLQICVVCNGFNGIRRFVRYCCPILISACATLLIWAYVEAGGFGPTLSSRSQFSRGGALEGQFWKVFLPALTACAGSWAGISLSIADYTRYSKDQKAQAMGHVGLPIFAAIFTFVGLAVTSSTEVIFGYTISNPIELLAQIGGVIPVLFSLFCVTLTTLITGVACDMVPSANALVNLNPNIFSFQKGAVFTAVLGIIFEPWRFMQNSETYINKWLVGYSGILGPLQGIILIDYYILHWRYLNVEALYSSSHKQPYWHQGGYNINAIVALLLGLLPSIPGFLYTVGLLRQTNPVFLAIYKVSWFSGFFIAGSSYWALSTALRRGCLQEIENRTKHEPLLGEDDLLYSEKHQI